MMKELEVAKYLELKSWGTYFYALAIFGGTGFVP